MKYPLVNVYCPRNVWVWHRLIFDGYEDLYPTAIGNVPGVGEQPDWWACTSFDEIAEAYNFSQHNEVLGYTYNYTWLQFAMENGIAPGQAFLISISIPVGYRSYDGDYDEEWSWEIVERAPLPTAVALKRWAHTWRQREVRQYMDARERKEQIELADRDVASMYIHRMIQGDGREIPVYVQLSLCTTRPFASPSLRNTYARSSIKKESLAMELLIEKAIKVNPYLSPEIIKSLPVRQY